MAQNRINKLELTWIGKEDNPTPLEPRILLDSPEFSEGTIETGTLPNGKPWPGNMLIHGDNLLALRALEQNFTGAVKCIYIDPPYNVDATNEYYDDLVEHSVWLNLMKPRLEILHNLLTDDGLLFVQIDDTEQAYLTILLDEIFGRNNRINTICVKMSEPSGVKMAHIDKRLPKLKEYILVYCKKNVPIITAEKIPVEEWNKEYKNIIVGMTEAEIDELHNMIKLTDASVDDINRCNFLLSKGRIVSLSKYLKELDIPDTEHEKWKFDNSKYIIQAVGSSSVFNLAKATKKLPQDIMAVKSATGLIYLIKTDVDENSKQPRVQVIFASENLMQSQGDLWLDIKTTGGVGQEGNVLFTNSKKPEKLIKKIISMCTQHGDIVLDSFLGSGTTAAVAHKMGRRWIGVELGDHAYTHCFVRLKAVVAGEQSGISKAQNWKGGGGFKFYELAPSLLNHDKHGNLVINKEYNADMLAAAMAKQEGYTYAPDTDVYWKQGRGSEKDFIFTTTQFLTAEALQQLHEQMGEDESLLICCTSFQSECRNRYPNITIKKIPQMLLGRCEFDKDNYSLNIVSLPEIENDEVEDEIFDEPEETSAPETNAEPNLFD